MEQRQKQFSLWYFLAAIVVMLAIQNLLFGPHAANLSYSEFKTLLKAGKVADLTLEERAITGKLKPEGLEGLLSIDALAKLLLEKEVIDRATLDQLLRPGKA